MAYCTPLNVAEYSGLSTIVTDETVGTGTGSLANFGLDYKNVVAGSYTIYYGSGNTRTALTETTHYTFDAVNGLIILTAAGITLVSTNNIYATYRYWAESVNSAAVSNYITSADLELELLTGRKWSGSNPVVEYKDGCAKSAYPSGDRPYDTSDYIKPQSVILAKTRIRKIDSVYFLDRQTIVGEFFNYDDNIATFTDYTDNVNDTSLADFTLFAAVPAVNDIIYIGCSQKFLGMTIGLSTLGTGSPAIDWEYYNGTTWADITETDVDTGASVFTASGTFTWSMPSAWTQVSVNSSNSLYYIRGKLSTGYTIAPIVNSVTIYDAINTQVHLRDISYTSWGKLTFLNNNIPNGVRNIRIDYSYGESSTPSLITELSSLLASIKAFVNLSGGSYDSPTSYTLGSKAITVGEAYVNVREVIDQFKKRKSEILETYGSRSDLIAI